VSWWWVGYWAAEERSFVHIIHASRTPEIVVPFYKYTMDTRRLKVTVTVGVGRTRPRAMVFGFCEQ